MPLFRPPDVEQFRVDGNVWGLAKALGHRRDSVRENAARALGEIAERLIDGLGIEELYMRQAVVEGLFQLRDARVVEPLIAALRDKNDSVRTAAANALGKISATRSEDLIVAHGDPFGYLRERVVQFRDARVVEPLIAALKDENDGVRTAAAKALGKISAAR